MVMTFQRRDERGMNARIISREKNVFAKKVKKVNVNLPKSKKKINIRNNT